MGPTASGIPIGPPGIFEPALLTSSLLRDAKYSTIRPSQRHLVRRAGQGVVDDHPPVVPISKSSQKIGGSRASRSIHLALFGVGSITPVFGAT